MKKILDNIKFILCVIFLLFAIIFKDNLELIVLVGGPFLVIIGIIMIINKEENSWILLVLGLTLSLSYLLYHFKILDSSSSIIFMLMISLFFILLVTVINYVLILKNNMKIHSLLVEAKVVDLIKNPNLETEVLIPLLEYKIKAEEFQFNYANPDKKYEIGESVFVYVNPYDLYDLYIPPKKKDILKNVAGTILVMVVSLIIIFDVLF